jgi:hypothetical protein
LGGNALKQAGVSVERKTPAEYEQICRELDEIVPRFTRRHAFIPAYREKESFGDLDCLIIPTSVKDLREALQTHFSPQAIVHNGECWSIDYKNFQVDFLVTIEENFAISYHYYSFNDLNNLVGRVAHKFGLKFGHKGLTVPVNIKDHQLGEIVLSKNPEAIYQYLDYSFERYQKGFNNLEEIYQFVASSKYFNPDLFAAENLNHANRTRNRKRPTYTQFLAWLENHPDLPRFEYSEDKVAYQQAAVTHFRKEEEQARMLALAEQRKLQAERFNGRLVQELTGLTGERLGSFIVAFKESIPDFEAWVQGSSEQEIRERIVAFK